MVRHINSVTTRLDGKFYYAIPRMVEENDGSREIMGIYYGKCPTLREQWIGWSNILYLKTHPSEERVEREHII